MKKLLLIIIAVLSASAVNAQSDMHKGALAAFDDTTYNYDTISKGSSGECMFEFTNVGDEPLIITSAFSSCGCTVPSWPKEPILPGDKNSINVKYNTGKAGAFSKVIVVKTNSCSHNNVLLRIKGVVKE